MEPEPHQPPQSRCVYLLERYERETSLEALRDVTSRIERVARDMTAAGRQVEHLGSIVVPSDGVVFCLIRAGAESDVQEMAERANAPADRTARAAVHGFGIPSEAAGERGDDPRKGELQ